MNKRQRTNKFLLLQRDAFSVISFARRLVVAIDKHRKQRNIFLMTVNERKVYGREYFGQCVSAMPASTPTSQSLILLLEQFPKQIYWNTEHTLTFNSYLSFRRLISPQSAIQCFPFQFSVSYIFLKIISSCLRFRSRRPVTHPFLYFLLENSFYARYEQYSSPSLFFTVCRILLPSCFYVIHTNFSHDLCGSLIKQTAFQLIKTFIN